MRFVFKILSVLVISGGTVFNVVACSPRVTDNNGDKFITYDIFFKQISFATATYFAFEQSPNVRFFEISKKNVLGGSGLPSNFWRDDNTVWIFVTKDLIWDKVASVYGFTRESYPDFIQEKMNLSIANISMTVTYFVDDSSRFGWNLLDFQIK